MDVLIDSRRIATIGPDLLPCPQPAARLTVLDGRARAVIPGLINAHTHLDQCVLRACTPTCRSRPG